jgi:hypothetical protein
VLAFGNKCWHSSQGARTKAKGPRGSVNPKRASYINHQKGATHLAPTSETIVQRGGKTASKREVVFIWLLTLCNRSLASRRSCPMSNPRTSVRFSLRSPRCRNGTSRSPSPESELRTLYRRAWSPALEHAAGIRRPHDVPRLESHDPAGDLRPIGRIAPGAKSERFSRAVGHVLPIAATLAHTSTCEQREHEPIYKPD